MNEEKRNINVNKKLLNLTIEKKFSSSFRWVIIGFVMVMLFSTLNIMIYAQKAGIGVFSSFSRAVGMCLLIFSVLMNIILICTISKHLTKALVVPIYELRTAVQKLKTGDFDIEIQYEGKDELGDLANDVREVCQQMKAVVADTGYMLEEMAEGHFQVNSKASDKYVGEFKALYESMQLLKTELRETLSELQTSSKKVMQGSEQLASSSKELAEGATNQASAVEEIAATVGNITNISEESADNAVKAAENAITTANDAKKSREGFHQLTDAMERITDTSKEIEKIIGAIEDIASQTNLLSLNASIEAARAGEAGRGFAVVADQIGKLATDSAQSAVTTKELISKSLTEIQAGNLIVENTMKVIDKVLVDMETFANVASSAAEASKMQVGMLKEVECGFEQITLVVENNSAAAEETSAVSQELSDQATNLEELVHKFRF